MKQKKMKIGSVLRVSAMVVVMGVLAFSVFRVVSIIRKQQQNHEMTARMAQMAVVHTQTSVQEAPEKQCLAEEAEAPPQAISMPISVDFALLQQHHPDIVAWIYCPDTPINYPVVQGLDNEFYLSHMADGQWNPGGSIFLDCRSSGDLTDQISLIHGHNQHTDAMFGTLPSYKDQAYYEQHRLLYILTPTRDYVLELFAGFVTDSDDGLYTLPVTEQAREKMIETCIARSDFSSGLQPGVEDRMVALSTCSYVYQDARYVVIGILRENQAG